MGKNLWDVFDGEPFMENPQLGILGLNPKRKRGKKMAVRRKRRVSRRGRKGTARRRTRAVAIAVNRPRRRRRSNRRRRNWAVAGSVVPLVNRPRRHRRRRNPVSHHRRRHRRNPAILGFSLPPVTSVLWTGLGFAGPSLVSGFLSTTFPSIVSTTSSMGILGKYVIKAGSVLGLAWLARKMAGPSEANLVMVGGGANIALTAFQDFLPGVLPANPLSTYIPTMAAYVPLKGMSGGMSGVAGLRGLRGRLPAGAQLIPGPGASAPRNGAIGGLAARYIRY